ncbi:hypothetical protein BH11PSE11_BH11PSE11_24050 [soil metagenome]
MKSPDLSRLVREPLLHFIVFGALIFGVDHVIAARQDNPRVIEVGAEVDKEAKAIFKSALGRDPNAQELKVLRERWIDNEVLYREGLGLRVDQGDPSIRERVIFKALNVMQANLTLPPIDDKGLRAWFEKNRANYDEPARFDFLEAVVIGDSSPEAVKKFIVALNSGVQGDAQGGLRIFKARPRSNLVTSYGPEFADAMEKLPAGEWHALPSKEGLRVIRLESRTAGVPVSYEAVQERVYQDWKDLTLQDLRTVAVRELGKKYVVKTAELAK